MKIKIDITNIDNTKILAQIIAKNTKKYDVILLNGDLGAGKTAFSQFFINSYCIKNQNVTSPTFNIVQTYQSNEDVIWHFDFYRLNNPSEVIETGLTQALDEGITIIEWPEIASEFIPKDHLSINISNDKNKRTALVDIVGFSNNRLKNISQELNDLNLEQREELISNFLITNSLSNVKVVNLKADASFRTYRRLYLQDKTLILMNAPPEHENIKKFIIVDEYLIKQGLNAPKIIYKDIENGLMVLEDFGNNLFTNILKESDNENHKESELYLKAIKSLDKLKNTVDLEKEVDFYSKELLLKEVSLLTTWYLPYKFPNTIHEEQSKEFFSIWNELLEKVNIFNNVVVLRDFHADNMIYLPEKEGLNQIGLLDFQDAVIGSPVYDLISLLEDARRDVSYSTVIKCKEAFISQNSFDKEKFEEVYNILAAQRNCKIIGIFVRLAKRDKKEHYLSYLPRVMNHLKNDLKHPALTKLNNWFNKYIFN